jgi:hypothetical protein
MPERVSFLFGSGISIPAGMPCVNQITEKVLSGNDVMRHTDGIYYVGAPMYNPNFPDEYVPRVRAFIKRLDVEMRQYYGSERAANYEDLYYVAFQICHSELRSIDNPIVQAFIDKILPQVKPLLIGKENDIKKEWKLYQIGREATYYISDIVWHFLKPRPANLDYLCCVGDACRDTAISSLDLFTLNHDIVLEQYLDAHSIKYTVGFELPGNNCHYWSPEVFADPAYKVRLLKLHGSVSWFRYESSVATGKNDPVGIADDGCPWRMQDPNGKLQWRYHGRPVLLVGTFNKMMEYSDRIFADLFCQLRHSLRGTDLLIVCGYSFGDPGINMQVREWADSSEKKVMVVIHEDPETLKRGARGEIFFEWDGWSEKKKLVVIRKWIQDTSWKDIQDAIRK